MPQPSAGLAALLVCIITQTHESLQGHSLIAFYVVPYPVIYHLVTGLYVTTASSYLNRLLEAWGFVKATEHSLPLWPCLDLYYLLLFHPLEEDIPLEEEYLGGMVSSSWFWLMSQRTPCFASLAIFWRT